MVAGSTASGIHGFMRTTADIDVVVQMDRDGVDGFVEHFQPNFYVDASLIETALRLERAFNIIHLGSSFKIDVFPLTKDRYQQVQFANRRFATTTTFGDPIEMCVCSPEDVILSKLNWHRLGGKSERQWNDVLGVISVQRGLLDLPYLRQWAAELKIADLLEQALNERQEPFWNKP